MKFEDKTHEETERKQRRARSKAWDLAKHKDKLKENDKATFFSLAEKWALPAASTKGGRKESLRLIQELVLVSKKDLNSAELKTMRTSMSPTTVVTANGELQTREEATMFLEEIPAILSLGNSVRIMAIHTTGPAVKNHICKNPKKPKTKTKMRNAEKYKEIHCMSCLIGFRNS